jgi:Cu-Zn family superoxide dismutase
MRSTRIRITFLATAVAALAVAAMLGLEAASGGSRELRAVAHISGAGISGEVRFIQAPADADLPEPPVRVVAKVAGLAPGLHGFHIHEVGTCAPPLTNAGGHFYPGPFGNSNPDANHPFHMGDLPNLVANEGGVGHLNTTTSRVTLSAGPLSVFDGNGSAVIVHANPDQGITGAPGSGVSGGPRIACGVIQPVD